jgi:uncharacterized protein YqeY
MGLREQISADMKTAMKEKAVERLSAIRLVQAAFKNREIELRPTPITEEDLQAVLRKLVKQRKESIEQYQAAGRDDLVQAETNELKLLETYLPQQLSREKVDEAVQAAIQALGAKTIKEMGAVMKEVMARTGGAADNKMVSELVKSRLA